MHISVLKGPLVAKCIQYVKEETITHVPGSLAIPSAVGSVQGTMGLLLTYPELWWRPPEDQLKHRARVRSSSSRVS
jgi:hypothetical protein